MVNGAQKSDRFIWDFHRTLKEMLAENHYGTLVEVLHEHKMGYYTEAQGDTPRAIGDGMTMKSRADIPTGEFWYRNFATDEGQPPASRPTSRNQLPPLTFMESRSPRRNR